MVYRASPHYYQQQKGFTIVELLIVVVVIAILATVTVIAYTGIQSRANNSAVRSDLSSIARELTIYQTTEEVYPLAVIADLTTALNGMRLTKSAYDTNMYVNTGYHNIIYCVSSDRSQYGIAAWSSSGQGFAIINNTVQDYSYAPDANTITCPRLVSGYAAGNYIWFYYSSAWRSFT